VNMCMECMVNDNNNNNVTLFLVCMQLFVVYLSVYACTCSRAACSQGLSHSAGFKGL
jgi:hypothetical protein